MGRLFTTEELKELAYSAEERLNAAFTEKAAEDVVAVYRELDACFESYVTLCREWAATILAFVQDRHGHAAMAGLLALEAVADEAAGDPAASRDGARWLRGHVEEAAALIRADDREGTLAVLRRAREAYRFRHDLYRDWASSMLSAVYREHGLDELERCLRYCSEIVWMPWMAVDIDRDTRERVIEWTRLFVVGNFAEITVLEDEERITLVQNVCGSCGRQQADGKYNAPWNLAIIDEVGPITFNRPGVAVYRTHMAVMHTLMPIERIGAPWPAIECTHTGDGGCRIHMYKNTRTAAPRHYEIVGKSAGR